MPAERRHILFTPVEYAEAIREYRRRRGQPLPRARLVRGAVTGEAELSVAIVLEQNGIEETISLGHDEALAALIFYCLNNRVPIPARTPKGLRRCGDALAITIEAEFPMRYGAERLVPCPGR